MMNMYVLHAKHFISVELVNSFVHEFYTMLSSLPYIPSTTTSAHHRHQRCRLICINIL